MNLRLAYLKSKVIQVFEEYGGWWPADRMAEWLDASLEGVQQVYGELEAAGVLELNEGGYP
jgi:hypothetical protein